MDVSVIDAECLSTVRSEFPMVLVANKADLESERSIAYQEGEELAAQLKVGLSAYLISVCVCVCVCTCVCAYIMCVWPAQLSLSIKV